MGLSCCGQAKIQQNGATNSQPPLLTGSTVTSQPSLHPGLNNAFQQPSISPPPPALPNANGFQQQPSWGQSHSPPLMNEFGASPLSQPTAVSTFNGTTYNGSHFNIANGFSSINQPIPRPTSAHSPHSPPQLNVPIQDEGKMSISIDFGMLPPCNFISNLISVQVQHFLVL